MLIESDIDLKNIFEEEQLLSVNGFPCLYKFLKGKKDKPLIVCVPGARSNGRIYYGVHKGHHTEDFLVHWLVKRGFSVLAISYPIELGKKVFLKNYPHFTVQDWGLSIATITEKIISENNLNKQFFLVGWSAGGKSVIPTSLFSQEKDIELRGFIGLAATPPIPGLMPYFWESELRESGYWHTDPSFPRETSQIISNFEKGGSGNIDSKTLLDNYLGHNPISLLGLGLRYHQSEGIVEDIGSDIQDNMNYRYDLYPLSASIAPTKIDDMRHSMTDEHVWTAIFSQSIYSRYFESDQYDPKNLSKDSWKALMKFISETPKKLHRKVNDSNHCFFIGKKGAQETALYIEELIEKMTTAEKQLLKILNP